MSTELTRRSALHGAGVFAVGGVAGIVVTEVRKDSGTETTAANAYGYEPAASGTEEKPLAAVADIPDGGGLILTGPKVVLTNDGGTIHAFSSICTHQGCPVDKVSGGTIQCPCHGSQFDATTGKVVHGPAGRPLPTVAVTVRDGEVYPS
jgi:nitrite reductase/ring-hydroxylating ferredoxin subunit